MCVCAPQLLLFTEFRIFMKDVTSGPATERETVHSHGIDQGSFPMSKVRAGGGGGGGAW